jgi:hypothetical protein
MRVVKPYGVSASHADEGKPLERFLHANSFPAQPIDVREFAKTHPTLVIAQWISCIDKIERRSFLLALPKLASRLASCPTRRSSMSFGCREKKTKARQSGTKDAKREVLPRTLC